LEERLKKRLIGAAVLASLAVIFVPMLVEKRPPSSPAVLDLPKLPEQSPPKPVMFEPPLLQTEVPRPVPRQQSAPAGEPEPVLDAPDETVADAAQGAEPSGDPTPPPETVAAPSPGANTPITAWVVRVGSFSSRDNAQRLVEKLREAGLDTMDPQPVDIRGRRLYRVQVGPEADRGRAESMLPRIKELTRLDGQVRSYP
jgi:DedD protein